MTKQESASAQCQVGEPLPIEIRALARNEMNAAAAILAHGMRDNPLHVRVFGANPDRRQQRLLRFLSHLVVYVHSNGEVLGAYVQGELIAVLGMIRPGRCRPRLKDKLHFGSVLLTSTSPVVLLRIHRWLTIWKRNDACAPHWHIGPLTVLPTHQGRAIGRRLMLRCCQQMDELAATAWLETDLEMNAAFYQSLGFVVVREKIVLGVPNWFMSRSPIYHNR